MRRAEQARDRRRTLLLVGAVAAAILVVAVVLIVIASRSDDESAASQQILPAAPTGSTTVQKEPASVQDTSGIPGVLAWDTSGYPAAGTANPGTLTHDHVDGPVDYAVVPPVGGPHDGVWMNAGTYTEPVPPERAVHDMEHGAVWIVYDADLPAEQVTQLTAFVGRQSLIDEQAEDGSGPQGQANRYIDLSPWGGADLPSPIVISSWGHQLRLDSATDPRLQDFVDTFRNSSTYTPEFGSPVDGIPIETGGRPDSNGSRLPNPEGEAK